MNLLVIVSKLLNSHLILAFKFWVVVLVRVKAHFHLGVREHTVLPTEINELFIKPSFYGPTTKQNFPKTSTTRFTRTN